MLPASLSIIIPAYNEASRLPSTMETIRQWAARQTFGFLEVVIVDDGSSDGTAELAGAAGAPFRLLRNPGNRGKGYAVRNGMLEAHGAWRLFTDADLSSPVEELEKLYRTAVERNCEIAIGSRALDRSLVGVRQPWTRELSGRLFNRFLRMLTGLPFRDTQCGFKLYSARAAEAVFPLQTLDGFSFDVEDLMIAQKLGIPAVEVAVRWNNADGTKVSLVSGLASFRDILRLR